MLSTLQLACVVAFTLYLLYYLMHVVRKPRLICGSANMRTFLHLNCGPLVEQRFWPPFWCIGANLQCLASLVFQNFLPLLPLRRQLLTLSDGGVVALDWLNEQCPPPVVLFLTGLTSDSQVYYLRTLVPLVAKMRCPCVVLNNRGQGGLPLNNHRLVSALSTDDLAEVLAAVRERFPGCAVLAVGYSMGGMLLSHYLLQTGDAAQVDAGLSISAPFHLRTSYDNLMSCSTSFLVNVYLAHWLLDLVKKNAAVIGASGVVDIERLLRCRTLYDFDNCYTAPVFGFQNAMEFYTVASLTGKLSTVRRPLLYLVAADDVFGSLATLPSTEIEQSPWLSALVTPRGGHLGFVDGCLWPRLPFYSERLAAAYVGGLLTLARGPLGAKALRCLVGVEQTATSLLLGDGLAEAKKRLHRSSSALTQRRDEQVAESSSGEMARHRNIVHKEVSV